MVLGAIIAGAPTAMAIGNKIWKHASKSKLRRMTRDSAIQAGTFGLLYGATTNIGYNVSNEGITKNFRKSYKQTSITNYKMPYYGRSYGRSNYSRYGKKRVWSRKYRKYIWVNKRRYY